MSPAFYVAVGIVMVPLVVLSLRRGILLGQMFREMVSDLERNQIKWEVAKLRIALLQWGRNPAKVVELCDDSRSREIVSRHAEVAFLRSKRLKRIITAWAVIGIAGVILVLFLLEPQRPSQVSQPKPAIRRG